MRIRYPLFLIVGFLCAAQSQAAGFFDTAAILGGGGVGQLSLTNDQYPSPSGRAIFEGFDSHSSAWNIFVGFEFNRYLAVEAGRLIGGTATQEKILLVTETDTTATYGDEILDVKSSAWHASVIGSWPVNDTISFFARGGMAHWQSTLRWQQSADKQIDKTTGLEVGATFPRPAPLIASGSNNGNDPFYGAGVAVNIDTGLLRLEYDLSKINGFDTRNIYLSVVWRFRPW